jgi:hypothetical protein
VLRVEALETRSNPSVTTVPVMFNMQANWVDPTDVVITGRVWDAHPASTLIQVSGGTGSTYADAKGGFTLTVHVGPATAQASSMMMATDTQSDTPTDGSSNGPASVIVQAEDTVNYAYSGAMQYTYGTTNPQTQSNGGAPFIVNVSVTNDGGVWHIHGQILDSTPWMTYMSVSSTIPDCDGMTWQINADGTFDVGVTLFDSVGGDVMVQAFDAQNGLSSNIWEGTIG